MPSLDERREVAARLRAIDDIEWTHPRDELRALDEAIGTAPGMPHALQTTWERLADLIEPEPERTCRIVGMDAAGNPPYNKSGLNLNATSAGCSECGFPFSWCRSLIQARNEVVACPNCGAKVTGGATCGN